MQGEKDIRSHSSFDNPLRHGLETVHVRLVIAFVDGEIEPVRPVDLDVQEPRADATRMSVGKGMSKPMGNG